MKMVFNCEAVWLPGGHRPAGTTPAPAAELPGPRLPPRKHSAYPEAPPGFRWASAPQQRGRGTRSQALCLAGSRLARPPSRLCGRRQESVASWGHLRCGRRGPALLPSPFSQPSPLDPDLTGSSVPLPVVSLLQANDQLHDLCGWGGSAADPDGLLAGCHLSPGKSRLGSGALPEAEGVRTEFCVPRLLPNRLLCWDSAGVCPSIHSMSLTRIC